MNEIDGSTGGDSLSGTAGADLINGAPPALQAGASVNATQVGSGLGALVFATAAPGDAGRLFLLTKGGVLRSLDLATGAAQQVADLSAEIDDAGEQGLLGLAFHPEFWGNGKLYLYLTNNAGDMELREYTVDPADQGALLASSMRVLLTVPQPGTATNHKAGWIGFGPDGRLHIATGDGGPGGDPNNTGQNPNDLLGSILRIDVDRDDFPADAARNYGIPAGNPFANGIGGAPEVWAHGLRNPYRDSFDRGTGALWIADVGQGRREEINIGAPGANFGWKLYEGDLTYPGGLPAGTLPPGITGPVFAYGRGAGDQSVTGGHVHRGPESGLTGSYIFGDFVSGRVWRLFDADDDGVFQAGERGEILAASVMGARTLTSFAEDAEGRLYAIGIDGRVLRLDVGGGGLDGADTIDAGDGDDRVFAGAGHDRVLGGRGRNLLSGMEGADTLIGGNLADTLIGGAGVDLLAGGAGNDQLMGGAGGDRLNGGAGNDLISGGAGGDVLAGGAGADRFRWSSVADSPRGQPFDRVLDFDSAAGDRLDLSALVGGTFGFIGTAGFAATGAQIRAVPLAGATRVEVSLDGGPADLLILVYSAAPIGAGDFIL